MSAAQPCTPPTQPGRGPSAPAPGSFYVTVGPQPFDNRAPSALRSLVRHKAEPWGLDRLTSELAQLVASELTTNALRHVAPRLTLRRPVQFSLTLGVERGGAGPDRVYLVAADNGPGGLRVPRQRGPAATQPTDSERGLLLLLGAGTRIESLTLPDGLHRVHAWSPLDAGLRASVCPCPCYSTGCGRADPSQRCLELVAPGTGSKVRVGVEMRRYCDPCARADRALDALAEIRYPLDDTVPVS